MKIRRVVPSVSATELGPNRDFYQDFLGFEPGMDEPGFLMFRSPSNPTAQVIVVTDECDWDAQSGRTAMSIEVEDVDAAYAQARDRGYEIVYPITDEAWGVRRFFVRDPNGYVLNINMHIADRD
ncbi:VOC family protein [Embleya sp. NPDC008237]|uniref:VOC family protein n=1 Tax=Embleya sp. NPDC008237 TaxID=3363978 RepID=UPI0036DFFCAA